MSVKPKEISLDHWNEVFAGLDLLDRLKRLFDSFPAEDILVTSSFGTTSAIMLHALSKVQPGHPVYFIDTGYLFWETLAYKDQLTRLLDLNVVSIRAQENRHQFSRDNKSWESNTDLCCLINKVEPLEKIKAKHAIWLSGLMGYQNANRNQQAFFESKTDLVKSYPLIDFSRDMASNYKLIYELPDHPLIDKGYGSIGCTHCTKAGQGRSGRWADDGTGKTECGIHTKL